MTKLVVVLYQLIVCSRVIEGHGERLRGAPLAERPFSAALQARLLPSSVGRLARVLYVRPEGKHHQSPPSHATYVQSTARIGPNNARLLFTRIAHR